MAFQQCCPPPRSTHQHSRTFVATRLRQRIELPRILDVTDQHAWGTINFYPPRNKLVAEKLRIGEG